MSLMPEFIYMNILVIIFTEQKYSGAYIQKIVPLFTRVFVLICQIIVLKNTIFRTHKNGIFIEKQSQIECQFLCMVKLCL